jgi:hypothetical protein
VADTSPPPEGPGAAQPGAPDPGQPGPEAPPAVDLQRLADKVYRLMQAEARLSQSRGQRPPRRPHATSIWGTR